MTTPQPIKLYEWIVGQFTVEGRGEFVKLLAPIFEQLIAPGAQILDLCCGAGPFTFLFEELGGEVTGIDSAPFMIERARKEAFRRGSRASFILADALSHELGSGRYDLVAFLGNTISDFPLEASIQLAAQVERSLRQGGWWAVHYIDGAYDFIQGAYLRTEMEQQEPVKVTRRFKLYRAEDSAIVETYRNEATEEEYDYTSYVYTAPVVRGIVGARFSLEQSIRLSERGFVDIFRKP